MTVYPIVAHLRPSAEQLEPTLVRGKDIVVTAGAGTGKTRTLVGRYLSLLADGVPLRSVVAITFTRKAAREMRNRIREEVRRFRESSEGAGSPWDELTEQMDAARIDTIHSLCGEILRRHPVEAGLDPRFALLDEAEMALWRAEAVGSALAWAADDFRAARLFECYRDADLRNLLGDAMNRALELRGYLASADDDLWATWEPLLTAPYRALLGDAELLSAMGVLLAVRDDGTLDRAEQAGDPLAPLLRRALVAWDAMGTARAAGDWPATVRHLGALRACLDLRAGRAATWNASGAKQAVREMRGCYTRCIEDELGNKAMDLDADRTLAEETIPAFCDVLRCALAGYQLAKHQAQALDYDDLEARTLDLLDNPDVLAEWQQEISALLVDEFQDTNARQRALVRKLVGDRGALFIVGDGKQSIYGFRGADVTVFRDEREAIGVSGAAFDLQVCYRAHAGLLLAQNALLGPVLGTASDPARPYVEPFVPARACDRAPAGGLQAPFIELHLALGPRDTAAARAARQLACRLTELMAAGITISDADPETGLTGTRPLDYGDVAILCRASTSFGVYEDALEQAQIPYLTISGRGFYGRPEVRDLLNALQAIADPSDDLALVGFLRSPACNVDDMTLYRLTQARRRLELPCLWDLLSSGGLRAEPWLAGEDALPGAAERVDRARSLVSDLHPLVGRLSVAEVLKRLLDVTHYRAMLLAQDLTRAVRNVDKLLSDAEASGLFSVGAFCDYVAALRDLSSREGEAHGLTTGAVQIMSIHQAKGLEFPVVVLGDAGKGSPRSKGLFIDADLGLVLPATSSNTQSASGDDDDNSAGGSSLAYRLAARHASDREQAEADRLLYVAATRAEELLLISGCAAVKKDGSLTLTGMLQRLDGALHLGDQLPACDADGSVSPAFTLTLEGHDGASVPVSCRLCEPGAEIAPSMPAGSNSTRDPSPAPIDLPDGRMVAALPSRGARADAALEQADRDPPQRVWRVVPHAERPWAPAWVVGQIVHRALALWHPAGDARFVAWATAEARTCGLTHAGEQANAVSRARTLLQRWEASDLYVAMASARERLMEVPYSIMDAAGEVDSGIIDALYRDAGQWTLVEFKTDRIRTPERLEAVLAGDDYVLQVQRYLAACTALLHEAPRPVLCFLDYCGGVHLVADRWA